MGKGRKDEWNRQIPDTARMHPPGPWEEYSWPWGNGQTLRVDWDGSAGCLAISSSNEIM